MVPDFVEGLAAHGDAPALVFPGRPAISYAQLARRVARQAAEFGTEKRLVAVEAASSEHAIVAYLAGLAGGHAVALLAPEDMAAAQRFCRGFRPELRFRRIGGRWRTDRAEGGSTGPLHPDLSLLLSTSGSTGFGKQVRLSGRSLASNAAVIASYLGLTARDRGALILPLHYCYGLSVLNAHLAVGASVYVAGGSILDTGFIEGLRESRCTNLAGVPYSYELLEKIGFRAERLPDLRFMTVAGGRLDAERAALYRDHLARQGGEFFVMYGQTEATARIAYVPPRRLADKPDSIGVPVPGGELRLVGEDGATIEAADTPGELVYRGSNVMMGYATTRADLARGPELDELRTGDLAVRDEEGFYRIVGRLRRMSKIAGLRIGHDALEAALRSRGIEAAVVGDDRRVVAFHAARHQEARVRRVLAETSGLTLFHVEARAVPELPRLSSGKIDYEALRLSLAEPARKEATGVREAFECAFFPRRVREQDSFASLEGDSLRYVQLSLALERALGRLPDGWEAKPLAELAAMRTEPAGMPRLDSDLVVRALAILLVVVQHATLWPVPGGAAAMVLLVGWSLARFQSNALFAGDAPRILRPLLAVLLPYYVILAGYGLVWGTVPWASVLLLGNLGFADPAEKTMLPFLYWFVEAYVQMVLLWLGLFLVPAVRRLARRHAFEFGLLLLAGAVALRFALPLHDILGGRQLFTLPWILYLAAFGWCAWFADTPARKLVLFGAGAVVLPLAAWFGGNWTGSWVKYLLQVGFLALLLWVPRAPVLRPLALALLPVAAASYHIYLFHRFAPEILMLPLEPLLPPGAFMALAIVGGVALGLATHAAQNALIRRLAAARPRIEPQPAHA